MLADVRRSTSIAFKNNINKLCFQIYTLMEALGSVKRDPDNKIFVYIYMHVILINFNRIIFQSDCKDRLSECLKIEIFSEPFEIK